MSAGTDSDGKDQVEGRTPEPAGAGDVEAHRFRGVLVDGSEQPSSAGTPRAVPDADGEDVEGHRFRGV
jgi:hypothetical protein